MKGAGSGIMGMTGRVGVSAFSSTLAEGGGEAAAGLGLAVVGVEGAVLPAGDDGARSSSAAPFTVTLPFPWFLRLF